MSILKKIGGLFFVLVFSMAVYYALLLVFLYIRDLGTAWSIVLLVLLPLINKLILAFSVLAKHSQQAAKSRFNFVASEIIYIISAISAILAIINRFGSNGALGVIKQIAFCISTLYIYGNYMYSTYLFSAKNAIDYCKRNKIEIDE